MPSTLLVVWCSYTHPWNLCTYVLQKSVHFYAPEVVRYIMHCTRECIWLGYWSALTECAWVEVWSMCVVGLIVAELMHIYVAVVSYRMYVHNVCRGDLRVYIWGWVQHLFQVYNIICTYIRTCVCLSHISGCCIVIKQSLYVFCRRFKFACTYMYIYVCVRRSRLESKYVHTCIGAIDTLVVVGIIYCKYLLKKIMP